MTYFLKVLPQKLALIYRQLESISHNLDELSRIPWTEVVVSICSFLTLLLVLFLYKKTVDTYNIQESFLKTQIEQGRDGLLHASIQAKNNAYLQFMDYYNKYDAVEGRRLLSHALANKTQVSLSGNGSRYVRTACETFDILGILVIKGVVDPNIVNEHMGNTIQISWQALNQKAKKADSSLVLKWRSQYADNEYLKYFEKLYNTIQQFKEL